MLRAKFKEEMTDEPSRKKRGADNQLTQDNWQEDADGDDDSEVSDCRTGPSLVVVSIACLTGHYMLRCAAAIGALQESCG